MCIHREQGIVERFNRTLAKWLFGSQYAQELLLTARGSSKRSAEPVLALPKCNIVATCNDELTRLTCKKPSEAVKAASVAHTPSIPALRVIDLEEPLLPASALVRYLYAPASSKVVAVARLTMCGL